ncbi:sigma factor [Streptomyces sp.]|jgi:DNA-directed RNA polymerase specialized sigma24 family protein|uniref:RNA polymerase sigma factor n=1 Tax=Streptomyces sp. TaxID=1931 RepID=UPI0025E7DFFA|nr:sigma factor [Streptomyces sp.]
MNVDDIVGETFLAAWRRRSELPEDPRPWLFGTARNAMLNAHRGVGWVEVEDKAGGVAQAVHVAQLGVPGDARLVGDVSQGSRVEALGLPMAVGNHGMNAMLFAVA